MSLPAGFGAHGMPVGLQLIGNYFKEALAKWRWGPLLLLLDSVDQLDDTNAGRRLEWLSLNFSDQVRLQC